MTVTTDRPIEDPDLVPPTIPVAPIVGRQRPMIATPLDGRYGPMRPEQLAPLILYLVEAVDVADVDIVLGIPESGTIPACAFSAAVGFQAVPAATRAVNSMR